MRARGPRSRTSAGASDRGFELDLGSEIVTIAPDRHDRQFSAAAQVRDGAILRREAAV